ncbi:MAG: hypothetical protein KDK36_16440 [Leptospiraceae bacterium]|nr:hypothetical protein [Leptospiraceae bacterium]
MSIPFEDVFWELVSNRNVSLRYRSARNIKGFNFDQQAKNNFSLLQTIQIIFFESNRKEILPQEKYNFGDYKIYFFDEDHVRLEYILKNNCDFLFYNNFPSDLWNNKKLFEYSNQLGYITSCPTNLGRGNKFSIKFNAMVSNNLPLFIELVNKNLLIMDSGSVDTNKPINLTFYIKNFNSISIKSFIYFSFYISNEFKF